MRELTTLERSTLFALQRSNRPMTSETLMSMTMEWREPLEAALDALTKAKDRGRTILRFLFRKSQSTLQSRTGCIAFTTNSIRGC
jgi:hypothetical protein